MKTFLTTIAAITLAASTAMAQTPPPPTAGEAPAGSESAAPPPPPNEDGEGPAMRGERGHDRQHAERRGPRHHMGPGGPRHMRGMRAPGTEMKVEIDEDGGVTVDVRCGPREEARACADITLEILDRVMAE